MVVAGAGVMCAVAAALFLWYVLLPVLSPYARARIPNRCLAGDPPPLPASLAYTVPGVGKGVLIAHDARAAVIRIVDSHHVTHAVLVTKDGRVVRELAFPTDVTGAAMYRGVAYIFNDAIGYFLQESTGRPVGFLVETDNYRLAYRSGPATYLQTDFVFSAIGRSGIFSRVHLNLHSVAYGCYFP